MKPCGGRGSTGPDELAEMTERGLYVRLLDLRECALEVERAAHHGGDQRRGRDGEGVRDPLHHHAQSAENEAADADPGDAPGATGRACQSVPATPRTVPMFANRDRRDPTAWVASPEDLRPARPLLRRVPPRKDRLARRAAE